MSTKKICIKRKDVGLYCEYGKGMFCNFCGKKKPQPKPENIVFVLVDTGNSDFDHRGDIKAIFRNKADATKEQRKDYSFEICEIEVQ